MQMRKLRLSLLIAFGAVLISPPARTQEEIYWHGDYKQALKVAKETGKPIFLEFRCEA